MALVLALASQLKVTTCPVGFTTIAGLNRDPSQRVSLLAKFKPQVARETPGRAALEGGNSKGIGCFLTVFV